jgi:hypothetical protein
MVAAGQVEFGGVPTMWRKQGRSCASMATKTRTCAYHGLLDCRGTASDDFSTPRDAI